MPSPSPSQRPTQQHPPSVLGRPLQQLHVHSGPSAHKLLHLPAREEEEDWGGDDRPEPVPHGLALQAKLVHAEGDFLPGIVVDRSVRRRGVGMALTRARLDWIRERVNEAFYFTNKHNLASIELHRQLGFEEVFRDVWVPGCEFTEGEGILFRLAFR